MKVGYILIGGGRRVATAVRGVFYETVMTTRMI